MSDRIRVPTPQPSTPQACIDVIVRMVARIDKAYSPAARRPVGAGVPGVVIDGVVKTAANIDPEWVDFDADRALEKRLKRPVFMVNDADAAGVAEMRLGVGVGRIGTVILLTLGTGTGSAIFTDGYLVPNSELGHMESAGATRAPLGSGGPDPPRAVVEGLGNGPRRAYERHPQHPLAEAVHPRRRGQQEQRPLHPSADRAVRGRPGGHAQRGRHRRRSARGAGPRGGSAAPV